MCHFDHANIPVKMSVWFSTRKWKFFCFFCDVANRPHGQYSQPCIWICHCFPPGLLYVLGVIWLLSSKRVYKLHPHHFHRHVEVSMSPLNWYKMVCMGDLAYAFILMEYIKYLFHVFEIWGSQAFSFDIYCHAVVKLTVSVPVKEPKHWAYWQIQDISWRRNQMETFSALLALCAGN